MVFKVTAARFVLELYYSCRNEQFRGNGNESEAGDRDRPEAELGWDVVGMHLSFIYSFQLTPKQVGQNYSKNNIVLTFITQAKPSESPALKMKGNTTKQSK